ncbi:LOW QUALITY PROTEIN: cholecystokinin receptor type a [Plakobranchus ocellatus]|uniref:Cholecystokinin receptor type a n=1 Tax=Plakobranchus ocellatus TaxID=259542 RepID=A0AAV3YRL4_9GAST|nr:LOW QUALITY PROTEIN: cholecystokinin receptor type a [Plakobranchus ocellatus]
MTLLTFPTPFHPTLFPFASTPSPAVSVGVSCGTLVAISLERFYAICQPLRSRRWQTLSHSYRVILAIWLGSVSVMIPIAVFNRDIKLKNGKHACREIWPSYLWESLYMVLLDMVLLVIPLFLMAFSYGHVAKELWSGVTISSTDPGSPLSADDNFDDEEEEKEGEGGGRGGGKEGGGGGGKEEELKEEQEEEKVEEEEEEEEEMEQMEKEEVIVSFEFVLMLFLFLFLDETESARFEVKDTLNPPTSATSNNLNISTSSLAARGHQNGYSTPRQGGSSPLLDRRQQNFKRSGSSESSSMVNTVNTSSSYNKHLNHHHANNHHNSTGSSNSHMAQSLIHPAYTARVLQNKKRVVKMLCVVVLEYFVCWTPLFLLNSWTVLDYLSARAHFTPLLKTAILLLAYLSSCIHPITYCFMNRRFRQSFADAFRCCFRHKLGAHSVLYSEASQALPAGGAAVAGKGQGLNGRAGLVGTNNRNFRITWKK